MKQPTFKKLILDELKAKGLTTIISKIKSIKYKSYSGGDSVNVDAIDLNKTERETLTTILNQYQDGHFDGMTDMYINGPQLRPRTAKYVFLNNSFTQAIEAQVVETLKTEWGITDDATAQEKMFVWYGQAVNRLLNDLESI